MSNEFDFSEVEVQEIPVTMPDKKMFTLKEASGKVAKQHRNDLLKCTKFDNKGNVIGMTALASVEAQFVAGCLVDQDGKNPSHYYVEGFPARIQKKLYEKAKEISDLKEEDPLMDALEQALTQDGTPIQFEDLTDYIKQLEGEEFRRIKRAFESKEEELEKVKN